MKLADMGLRSDLKKKKKCIGIAGVLNCIKLCILQIPGPVTCGELANKVDFSGLGLPGFTAPMMWQHCSLED